LILDDAIEARKIGGLAGRGAAMERL